MRKNTDSQSEHQCPLRQALSYTPYGYRSEYPQLLGFNGERTDPVTGDYLLGSGYRAFNPALMRFNSTDSMSPFGRGGVNPYVYCLGDPINFQDPSGRFSVPRFISRFFSRLGLKIGLIKQSKGSDRLVESVITSETKTSITSTRARSASAPSLSAGALGERDLRNWDFIGYHGSSAEHGSSLFSGLDPKFQGSSHAQLFGRGFYFAPEPLKPLVYALNHLLVGKRPAVYGVYTENFSRLRSGRDYSFRVRGQAVATRSLVEIVIRQPAYHLIAVRSDVRETVVLPRPNEAPF